MRVCVFVCVEVCLSVFLYQSVCLSVCLSQGSKNVFESGRQFGHLEERLVAKLLLVSRSDIPEVNKSLISLLRPFPRLSCLTLH